MKYKKFDTLLIDVLARDIVDDMTVVRYIDENGDIKKLEISKIDYDILPNKKLLLAMVGDDVLAYCKHRYDIFNHTLILKDDITFFRHTAEKSKFIISEVEDIIQLKKSSIKSKIPKILLTLGLASGVASVFFFDHYFISRFLMLVSYWFGGFWFFLSLIPEFNKKDNINIKYTSLHDDFILDIQQKLTDNKHLL